MVPLLVEPTTSPNPKTFEFNPSKKNTGIFVGSPPCYLGALIIRIGFWGILCYKYN